MPQVQVIQPIQQQPKRLRVAAYARVSSKSTNQLNSMSVQVEYYTDLIQKNPNWEFVGVYADEGISGTGLKNRAGFNHLMDDCRLGLIDRILVKSSSRMAPAAAGGGENCTATRNISGYGKVLSLRPFGVPPSQRCVQIHGQPFNENQHRHILLADFSAPIFHFQKNVNLRKIHEVDYAEKDCNNCCSLFG